MEKEPNTLLQQSQPHHQSKPTSFPQKSLNDDISLQSTQLISFQFHNDVLKRIISQLTQKSKHQQFHSQTIENSLKQLQNDFSVLRHELNRMEGRREMREVDIDNRFRKREEVEFNLKHDMNFKIHEIKSQLSEMNFGDLRMEVKQYVEKKKKETVKEIEDNLVVQLEKTKISLLSKMFEDTTTMIIEATNKIEENVEKETSMIKEFKQETSLQSKRQEKRLEDFLKQSAKYFEKNDEKLRAFKEDILQNVPSIMLTMLDSKREQDDGKVRELIAQQENKRQMKQTIIQEKIQAIEEKDKRLEELMKQFQIQILLIGNNVATKGPAERRASKLTPINSNNVNYAKKMSYDVMIEKILLAQEQLASNTKSNQALKQKIVGLESQLHSNPILSNLSDNPYIKQLLDNMLEKSLRSIEGKIVDKLDFETYDKDLKMFTQRMDVLTLSIIDKCEKEEVKKAFRFLEQKIKEVIILVGGTSMEEERDPFIQKKEIFKCLSCDKTVEKQRDFAKTATAEYRVWKKIAKQNTERVNQLGLGNTSSIKRLLRTGTAKNTERVKINYNN